jgi:hypothetical protein
MAVHPQISKKCFSKAILQNAIWPHNITVFFTLRYVRITRSRGISNSLRVKVQVRKVSGNLFFGSFKMFLHCMKYLNIISLAWDSYKNGQPFISVSWRPSPIIHLPVSMVMPSALFCASNGVVDFLCSDPFSAFVWPEILYVARREPRLSITRYLNLQFLTHLQN